ncbi:DUF2892 domain-containing protein [Mesobacillus thioparans]|uniref:YgaP family membrane protein n=1 Tax=Mesobacillus thioparans TaxID=370439 RepID=UPI0039EECDEC
MKKNVGNTDRIIRAILGLLLVSFFFLADGGLKYLGIAGLVLFFTSIVKFCPLYLIAGLNTNKNR